MPGVFFFSPRVCTHKSDSVMSRIVSHVSNPWSRKTSRYCEMPSSPNTSCNFGDMQNTDYCLGIESIEHDESLVGPVLSVRGASPEAKKKGRRRARFYGPRGCFKNVVRVGVSCLCASGLDVPYNMVSRWLVPSWVRNGRVSFCSCALLCEAARHAARSSQE